MKKNKNRNQFKINLYSKSQFFIDLSKRTKEMIKKVEEEKTDYIINKCLGNDKIFNRDYFVFSYNNPIPMKRNYNHKINKSNQKIRLMIKSTNEINESSKYEKKNFKTDPFSDIYTDRKRKIIKQLSPKKKINLSHNNNKHKLNDKDKFLGYICNFNNDIKEYSINDYKDKGKKNKCDDKTFITQGNVYCK